jgi:tetratricopeptide (TPR) repeat protein
MFFMRLRRGAKWVFILLVAAFAFGFLFQGVGSGGGGDIISQLLGMRGGNAIKSAENDVKKHPRDASALRRLAQLYESKNRQSDAINAYERFLKLKPTDTSGLLELGRLWEGIANQRWSEYNVAQQELLNAAGPLSSDPLQNWFGQDPILTPYITSVSQTAGTAYSAYQKASRSWEDVSKRYLKAIPASSDLERAQAELQLGQAATDAGDYATAIKAYKTFLILSPKSPIAPEVRKALKELQKANSKR